MRIAVDTIIQKMMQELQQAKQNQQNQQTMLKHIEHVKLLCDLFLMESQSPKTADHRNITAEEMKAMVGESQGTQLKPKIDDHADGTSIFDF